HHLKTLCRARVAQNVELVREVVALLVSRPRQVGRRAKHRSEGPGVRARYGVSEKRLALFGSERLHVRAYLRGERGCSARRFQRRSKRTLCGADSLRQRGERGLCHAKGALLNLEGEVGHV